MKVSYVLKIKGNSYYSIGPDQSLIDAVRVMMQHKIGALVVMDDQRLISIITERDILGAVDKFGADLKNVKVNQMMAPQLVVCGSEDTVDHAMHLMTHNLTKHRIRHLPVVNNEKLIGVISIGDIVQALLTETTFENRLLKHYIKSWPEEEQV